ncbi:hypothetical protein [Campylobacter curvus]|uniref:hypothetical protein n=1 Tax=Campylobacter curvus TaxID=200 RepID=UPI0014701E2D|nr:hypothetical protein [Campylobacter curvus]
MSGEETELFKKRFKEVDELISTSKIYENTLNSFTEGLKLYSVNEQEKSMAFADFMSKSMSALVNIASETALRLGISYEQEVTEQEKREAEISALEENVLKIRVDQEVGLASLELMRAQGKNEALRKIDLEAGVKLKQQQLLGLHITNIAENEKRKVLIKTANDNAIIKRGEHMTNYLKVLSDDKDFNIKNEKLHEIVKDNLLKIGENPLEYTNIDIPEFKNIDINFDAAEQKLGQTPIFRIITDRDMKKGKFVNLFCLAAGVKDANFKWLIEDKSYTTQKVRHEFIGTGEQTITCEITEGDKTYTKKETINVR